MSCNLCTNPALCNPVCRAFEFAPAAVRAQLREDCAKSGQMTAEEVASHMEANEMPNVYDEEWVCEAHPDKPFLHDGCPGPGMLSDESCARLEQVAAHVEAGEMPVVTEQKGQQKCGT